MKKQLIWVLSAVLLSGVSVAALASGHGMDRQEQRSHVMKTDSKKHEAHIARMEKKLGIKESQRPAWDAYKKQTADLVVSQQKGKETMQAARLTLLSQLDPEQQTKFQSSHKKNRKDHRSEKNKNRQETDDN